MRRYEGFSEEARQILDDLVDEMEDQTWTERWSLVSRVLQVEQVALSLKAGDDCEDLAATPDEGLVAELVAAALDRLDADEPVCSESAQVLLISADARHRAAARAWFAAHPGEWEALQPTLH